MNLPRGAEPFVAFPQLLRAHGFAVAPEQTISFLQGVGLLGPRHMRDIYRAAHATLGPPPERRAEFDALFRFVFHGHSLEAPALGDGEDELKVTDERGRSVEPPAADERNESGAEATRAELLGARSFATLSEPDSLRRFRREVPGRLPRRLAQRRRRARNGAAIDLRQALRLALRRDGEVLALPKLRRTLQQRRILLLVDVSGSMKRQTETSLRFAHALAHAAQRIEVFTAGTRLTRVTRSLRLRDPDRALAAAAGLVADWDGGTRLGGALQAFLAVPRFAGFARGSLVLILSDGLERGDPAALRDAVTRLARLAWQVHWLTPLLADPGYRPETAAMAAILPRLDRLADGGSLEALCRHVLGLGERRAA